MHLFGLMPHDLIVASSVVSSLAAQQLVSAKSKRIIEKEDPTADEINFALPLPSQIAVGNRTRKDQHQQVSEQGLKDATALGASSINLESEGTGEPAASGRQYIGRCRDPAKTCQRASVKFGKQPHGLENSPSNVASLEYVHERLYVCWSENEDKFN